MARIRSIHPDACDSEKLARLSDPGERLFWRLQTHCDDDGRCDDNVRLIAAKCVPLLDWTSDDVNDLLDELEYVGLLVRYEVAGKGYVQVVQWDRFQKPRKPQRGKRPPVPANRCSQTGGTDVDPVETPVAHQSRTGSDSEGTSVAQGVEWSGEERRPPEGGGGSRGEGETDPLLPTPDPVVTRLHSKLAEREAIHLAAMGEPR